MEIDVGSQHLLVDDRRIGFLLVGDARQPWFQAKPLAELLGYENPTRAICAHVLERNRRDFQGLKATFGDSNVHAHSSLDSNLSRLAPQTVFVDGPGLHTLLMRSNLPKAERIQEWVTAVVLPTIRRSRSDAPRLPGVQARLQMQQACRGFLDCYKTMVELGMATGTDRLFFADLARNAAMPLSSGEEDAPEERLSDICREVLGRSGTKTELTTIGRLVARAYKDKHEGAEPPEVERWIDGTTRMVNVYSPVDVPWIRDFVADVLKPVSG